MNFQIENKARELIKNFDVEESEKENMILSILTAEEKITNDKQILNYFDSYVNAFL